MGEFTLDMSGAVPANDTPRAITASEWRWLDLSLFEQGYIEALFAEQPFRWASTGSPAHTKNCGFSDLAPETLVAIRKDCAAHLECYPYEKDAAAGARFWNLRNINELANWFAIKWPPLTVTLSDDGKVRFT